MRIVLQRRGVRGAQSPDAERLQRGDGTGEQGGGAVVGLGRALADQHGRQCRRGQRDRRGQPGRAAADHDRRGFLRCCPASNARSVAVNRLARAAAETMPGFGTVPGNALALSR